MYVDHGRCSTIEPSILERTRGLPPTAAEKAKPKSGKTRCLSTATVSSPEAPASVRCPVEGSAPRRLRGESPGAVSVIVGMARMYVPNPANAPPSSSFVSRASARPSPQANVRARKEKRQALDNPAMETRRTEAP